MAFYETTWWTFLDVSSSLAWVVFLVSNFLRRRAVAGTAPRYLYATLAWSAAYPALGIVFTGLIRGAAIQSPLSLIIGFCLLAMWLFEYRDLVRSDDDNWFRRTGKRLRRWVASHAGSLTPAPSRI